MTRHRADASEGGTAESCEIVAFDGLRMFLSKRGAKSALPTVVLEAGGGGTSAWWGWVQERLAPHMLVVRYDRAGLGASDTEAADMGAAGVAARLEALLEHASIPGPYLFVGHSLGGLFVQYYAATRPRDAAGLVLVDPTPSDTALFGQGNRRVLGFFIFLMKVCRLLARLGLLRFYNPASQLVTDLPPRDAEKARLAARDPRHLRGFVRELREIVAIQKAVSGQDFPREIPMLVVSAGVRRRIGKAPRRVAADAADDATDPVLLHRLDVARKSDHGCHVTVAGSTHGSIVTRREHAHELADRILQFAGECRSVHDRRSGK